MMAIRDILIVAKQHSVQGKTVYSALNAVPCVDAGATNEVKTAQHMRFDTALKLIQEQAPDGLVGAFEAKMGPMAMQTLWDAAIKAAEVSP